MKKQSKLGKLSLVRQFKTVLINRIVTVLACLFSMQISSIAWSNNFEVMHFWISPSESAAIQVFVEDFERRGGLWLEDTQQNFDKLKEASYQNLMDGVISSAVQSTASTDKSNLVSLGLLTTFEKTSLPIEMENVEEKILDLISIDDQVIEIPVSMHGHNWSFYSSRILKELDFEAPTTWDAFFQRMEQIKQAGYKTIAMSDQFWEFYFVFKAILISEGGLPLYEAIRTNSLTFQMNKQLESAIDKLIRFRDLYRESGYESTSWSDASKAVVSGQAAVQFMGDWAKGEMLINGAEIGKDFICEFSPGSKDIMLIGLDTFYLPKTQNQAEIEGQNKFIQVILNPSNQVNFSNIKGSIAVLNSINKSRLDECGKKGYSIIYEGGQSILSQLQGEGEARAYTDALSTTIQKIWEGEISEVDDANIHIQYFKNNIQEFNERNELD